MSIDSKESFEERNSKRQRIEGFKRDVHHLPIPNYTFTPKHPLGVKPLGNSLLADSKYQINKNLQMGTLSVFPEDVLLEVLSYLNDPKDLMNLSHCSRVIYAYCWSEELWRQIYMNNPLDFLKWQGSWRRSLLNLPENIEAKVKCSGDLLCSDLLYRPYQCSQVNYEELFSKLIAEEYSYHLKGVTTDIIDELPGRIPRLNESEMSLENFRNVWHGRPFILTNSFSKRWPNWTIDSLLERFPNVKFRQEAVKWPLSLYSEYFDKNQDESPLYLFDARSDAMKQLIKEYKVPDCFQDDLFKVFDESSIKKSGKLELVECRPDHAWLIVGPKRSGSTFHKDPNHTSAWNTTLSGKKLWVMTPPNVVPPGVSTDLKEDEVTSPIGIAEWCISGFYNDALKMAKEGKCVVAITFPGECLYVPSCWWHAVINIDDCVALTQNFVPLIKLPTVLNFFKNKDLQISGFYPKKIIESLKILVKRTETKNENILEFKKFIENYYRNENLTNPDEDIGELLIQKINHNLKLPIYSMFKELLIQNGYEKELQNSELELQQQKNNKKKWSNLTNANNNSLLHNIITKKDENQTEKKFGFGFYFNEENDSD
ncbi:hypothetical protein PACTADRAFT_76762 [Pachysolen tannophilus NRRL Y-2460]|uniref:JmjC domain-containing protein n=1 Tax=Pachysolen tannophilus NRRL Y-2460 TaxID=669874 RepID=A0A1E4TQV2_PACTA|nr:hypothetical protein PACTADRAFT_76762 [Pachysolen tannophilus NRRL Y-2460]